MKLNITLTRALKLAEEDFQKAADILYLVGEELYADELDNHLKVESACEELEELIYEMQKDAFIIDGI